MSPTLGVSDLLNPSDTFARRHIGPSPADVRQMLATLGVASLEQLIDETIPAAIRVRRPLALETPCGEHAALAHLREIARQNRVFRSLIGMGYYDCITPPVIQRNILENPGWYTQYTPYQAEISQGRLEALLNFQTMVADLTALPLANASLLDEATAAAEAMTMCKAACDDASRNVFFVATHCHPQTITVVQTRARALGIEVRVGSTRDLTWFDSRLRAEKAALEASFRQCFGVLLQYPTADGSIEDYTAIIERVHADGARVVVATDLLALTLLKPPGEFGADIAVGSSQRFGVPLGYGGPHAAFMACRDEYKRQMPGRIIGVSKDAHGQPAYRLAIQTREQHIRREKATSNICTAQVLLAVMAGMYAVYHGPDGLKRIAERVHRLTCILAAGLRRLEHPCDGPVFFDTLRVNAYADAYPVLDAARKRGINLREIGHEAFGVALDETTTLADVQEIFDSVVAAYPALGPAPSAEALAREVDDAIPPTMRRTSAYLTHPVFNSYHAEHELLRYIKRLESRDLSLTTSMIPLGSCTMKLNAAVEMFPVSWPEFAGLHPFAPADQTRGYATLFRQLEAWLAEITGFAAVSLQPNAGSQGEYAGLLVIRAYHESRGDHGRDVCLIPTSAHGTNPASAVTAGFQVVTVRCDEHGNVDLSDLEARAREHRAKLGALMITYPSTHGVFEEDIRRLCEVVHQHGGQVYMDGANMNAQVGLCRPGDIGADVCHLNLHKTFCIPHGGGGPGMGPIAVATHLAAFLPGHPVTTASVTSEQVTGDRDTAPPSHLSPAHLSPTHVSPAVTIGPVSAAQYGSPSILPISWMYIRMMGAAGLEEATRVAILNANYMAARLAPHYPVLYSGKNGRVAHEFILDTRPLEHAAGIKVEDIAKRLMDYGFHAPTMSFPVPGTLMIEPTESESKAELDRLCDALIAIREEIRAIEEGRLDRQDNPLKHAPHTAQTIASSEWSHPYPREQAAFPAAWVRQHKFWPAVGRIDNVYGDRHLFCTCPPPS